MECNGLTEKKWEETVKEKIPQLQVCSKLEPRFGAIRQHQRHGFATVPLETSHPQRISTDCSWKRIRAVRFNAARLDGSQAEDARRCLLFHNNQLIHDLDDT